MNLNITEINLCRTQIKLTIFITTSNQYYYE